MDEDGRTVWGLRRALADRHAPEAAPVWVCLVEVAVRAHGTVEGSLRVLAWMSGDLAAAERAVTEAPAELRERLEGAVARLPVERARPVRVLRRIRQALEPMVEATASLT